jgi:hypothetical protein
LFESQCQQNHKDAPKKAEDGYLEPPGHDRNIRIGHDDVPWYPDEHYREEAEHEGQRADMSKRFHGSSLEHGCPEAQLTADN